MPVNQGKDNQGNFFRWGKSGKKYYFNIENKESRKRARNKALRQSRAIFKGD
jgi:hypothetical protein